MTEKTDTEKREGLLDYIREFAPDIPVLKVFNDAAARRDAALSVVANMVYEGNKSLADPVLSMRHPFMGAAADAGEYVESSPENLYEFCAYMMEMQDVYAPSYDGC